MLNNAPEIHLETDFSKLMTITQLLELKTILVIRWAKWDSMNQNSIQLDHVPHIPFNIKINADITVHNYFIMISGGSMGAVSWFVNMVLQLK